MKSITRFLLLLCAATMFISCFTLTAVAKEAMVVSSTKIDASQKDEQTVTVSISGNDGIIGFKLHFEYNEKEVEIISATAGTITKKGSMMDNIGLNKGKFDVLWNHTSNVTGDGSIIILNVKCLTDKGTTIKVSYSGPDTCSYDSSKKDFNDVFLNCNNIVSENAVIPNTTTEKLLDEQSSKQTNNITKQQKNSTATMVVAVTDKKGEPVTQAVTDPQSKEPVTDQNGDTVYEPVTEVVEVSTTLASVTEANANTSRINNRLVLIIPVILLVLIVAITVLKMMKKGVENGEDK